MRRLECNQEALHSARGTDDHAARIQITLGKTRIRWISGAHKDDNSTNTKKLSGMTNALSRLAMGTSAGPVITNRAKYFQQLRTTSRAK